MSTNGATTRVPSPEEIAAIVLKANAEAAKALADARKSDAEARSAELAATQEERAETALLATDEFHFVYRFMDQVSSASVLTCTKRLTRWSRNHPGQDIEIIFSSPGGGIFDGIVLFDFIRELSRSGHKITTGVHGMAASMAGILVQAGDHRWIGEESWYMIHRAAFGKSGKTFEVEDEVEFVKRIEKRIIQIFTSRTNLSAAKIKRNWDRKDWWLDSGQSLELGLVDEIR